MPQKADPLTPDQVQLLGRWINEGATWPDNVMVRDDGTPVILDLGAARALASATHPITAVLTSVRWS